MLIERLRSRARTGFPSHAQMKALREKLYYKKLRARVAPLEIEVKEDRAFLSSDDFAAAGLTMVTPDEIETSRFLSVEHPEAKPHECAYTNSTLRSLRNAFSFYEESSQTSQELNLANCNDNLDGESFFQFKITDSVWNKYEACCAKECKFMARYGKKYSAGSANCCAGCNRAKCSAKYSPNCSARGRKSCC